MIHKPLRSRRELFPRLIRAAATLTSGGVAAAVIAADAIGALGWRNLLSLPVLLLMFFSLLPFLLYVVVVRSIWVSVAAGLLLLTFTISTYGDIAQDDSSTAAIRFFGALVPNWLIAVSAAGIDAVYRMGPGISPRGGGDVRNESD